jgi:heme/copper-type cytochrome/quinol oxidase subunit 2
MTEQHSHISSRKLRTPRTAAIAGIVFGVLLIVIYATINLNIPAVPDDTGAWLETSAGPISMALTLVPFAGIAFLWFMGVVRDRLGLLEDQFFSTLFFGSGLLYLAMVFVGAALAGGILTAHSMNPGFVTEGGVYIFARAMIFRINNVYSIRMAGMFMFVLATIWMRTKIMPRWVALSTYALALVLLVSVGFLPWMTTIFPAWVLLTSAYILFLNYRYQKEDDEGPPEEEG